MIGPVRLGVVSPGVNEMERQRSFWEGEGELDGVAVVQVKDDV